MAFNETIMFCKPEPGDDLALDPCPFCGEHNVVYEKYQHAAGERWRVVCPSCCASVDPGYAQERHVVQRLWNRRAEKC